eukprot:scaffold14897_cov108-Isochrysis_galbana.AAC.4
MRDRGTGSEGVQGPERPAETAPAGRTCRQTVGRVGPAETVTDERQRRYRRGCGAEELGGAELALQLLAERDAVVQLLQQLRADAAQEGCRGEWPPELEAPRKGGCVHSHKLLRDEAGLRQRGQREDNAEPAASYQGYAQVRARQASQHTVLLAAA